MIDRDAKIVRLEAEIAEASQLAEQILATRADLQQRVETARSKAVLRGEYMDTGEFNRLVTRLSGIGREHQAALQRVARAKRELKPLMIERADAENAARRAEQHQRELGFAEHFMNVARELLDPDVFATLMKEATLAKTRELVRYQGSGNTVGAAIGMLGSSGGMRQRRDEVTR